MQLNELTKAVPDERHDETGNGSNARSVEFNTRFRCIIHCNSVRESELMHVVLPEHIVVIFVFIVGPIIPTCLYINELDQNVHTCPSK